jgi:tRNA-Thr(GGU) m(6)t(6)A37 methyltransferase TsaA
MRVELTPIGRIEGPFAQAVPDGWETLIQRIIVDKQWTPALEGLEGFSHLIVLFWLDRIEGALELKVHPENRQDLPAVGLFATRTPRRPNRIALQVVELLSRQDNVLTIRGLDALDNSPVLDLKPYLPRGDSIPGASTPQWVEALWVGRPAQ